MKLHYIIALFLITPMLLHAQRIWYVTEAGSGTLDGSAWNNASDDLAVVAGKAAAHDTIWVAEGRYVGGFTMKDGVQVYGGFSGNERFLHERKLPGSGKQLTILDGDHQYRVLTQPEAFDNITIWDGFIIQNGQANNGGGVYLRSNGVLRRSVITQNIAGIPSVGEYLTQEGGVVFRTDNEEKKAWIMASENYGANYQLGASGFNLKNTLEEALNDMDGNGNTANLSAGRAAQVVKKYRAPSPAHTFDDWFLPSAGEWACFLTDTEKNKNVRLLEIVDETLLRNDKTPLSGNRYWTSTSATQNGLSSAWYVNLATNDFNITNVWQYNKVRGVRTFTYTIDSGRGGAIYATAGSRVEGCLVYDNISALGYAVCARGDVRITNSTIVGNVSQSPTINSFAVDGNSNVKLLNSIITGNFNALALSSNHDNDVVYQHSAIETTQSLATGNISLGEILAANGAKFIDPSANNYQLQQSSVCTQAGNVELLPAGLDTDIAGNKRVGASGVSMGAYEPLTASALETPVQDFIAGIYPNPVNPAGYFTVELHNVNLEQVTLQLFNMLGMKLADYNALQLNKLQAPSISGVYVLRLNVGKELHKEFKIIVR